MERRTAVLVQATIFGSRRPARSKSIPAILGAILILGGCTIAGVREPDGTTRLTDEQYLPPIGALLNAARPGKVILGGDGTRPLPPQPPPWAAVDPDTSLLAPPVNLDLR